MSIWLALPAAALIAWLYLLCFHGRFWRADQRLDEFASALQTWPDVVAIIPARDEAETIGDVLRAHMASAYPGGFSVIVVDDHSSDDTGDIARDIAEEAARPLHVTSPPPLEKGWTGKLWALHHGLNVARTAAAGAAYVLFTDADIVHGRWTLGKLVAKAEDEGPALVSLMARLDARGLWGGLLIPAFIFFFQKLYPFPQVNNPRSRRAAAAGGCVLVRRDALNASGGLEPIKDALIDDCALARLVKGRPPERPIWLGLADEEVVSRRDNRAIGSIWMMVARTAYAQLSHSPLALAGTLIGMALLYLAGPLALLTWPLHHSIPAAAMGLVTWALMTLAYAPTARLYKQPAIMGVFLPISGLLYAAMTFDSARRYWAGEGGLWKGRTYRPSDDTNGANRFDDTH